eukprot:2576962-Rhodomonas_salina.1
MRGDMDLASGRYSTIADLNFSGQVRGEAVPIQGEYAAIAIALQCADPNLPLAILTNCLSPINVFQHWKQRDFSLLAKG